MLVPRAFAPLALVVALLATAALAAPPLPHVPGTITVASWNILNLGAKTDVELRAQVVVNFDLVAVQEIESPAGFERLRRRAQELTGVPWASVLSDEVGVGQAAEYYGFLYRTDRVSAWPGPRGHYVPPAPSPFARNPFYATFRAGAFDFTVAEIHVTGKPSTTARLAEVLRLPEVWQHVQDADPHQDDVLLCGDFNLEQRHKGWFGLLEAGATPTLTGPLFTTFSSGPARVGASFFDNLFTGKDTAPEYTGTAAVFPLHERFCLDAVVPHLAVRTKVSDHLPVWARFRTVTDDDGPPEPRVPSPEAAALAATCLTSDVAQAATASLAATAPGPAPTAVARPSASPPQPRAPRRPRARGPLEWPEPLPPGAVRGFLGNDATRLFHAPSCRRAPPLRKARVFDSAMEALAAGLRPCPRCCQGVTPKRM